MSDFDYGQRDWDFGDVAPYLTPSPPHLIPDLQVFTTNNTSRPRPAPKRRRPTKEERQEMSWQNPAAAKLAREILNDKTEGALREKVTEAVAHLSELVADTECGSTLTFMKTNDDGKHYFYACVKNGERWYTTAQAPRVLDSDDELIEWMIGLEIFEPAQLEVQASKHVHALAAGAPIEATAVDA